MQKDHKVKDAGASLILALLEAEAGRTQVQGQLE